MNATYTYISDRLRILARGSSLAASKSGSGTWSGRESGAPRESGGGRGIGSGTASGGGGSKTCPCPACHILHRHRGSRGQSVLCRHRSNICRLLQTCHHHHPGCVQLTSPPSLGDRRLIFHRVLALHLLHL